MTKQTINGQPAVYNATAPTLDEESGVALRTDIKGNLKTTPRVIVVAADERLITRTSIAFEAGDTLTTEKLTAAISLIGKELNQDNEMRLCVDKSADNTAGDMTINIYEECKVDGTNARYCKVANFVVEKITDAGTFKSINLSGAGYGTGNIKIGCSFSADSGAITPFFALYRK